MRYFFKNKQSKHTKNAKNKDKILLTYNKYSILKNNIILARDLWKRSINNGQNNQYKKITIKKSLSLKSLFVYIQKQ